jgi:DNA-binding transcriptional MerR regulator
MTQDLLTLKQRTADWLADKGFSDEQVAEYSGVSVRNLRELAQLGAINPLLTGASGRGAKRMWDRRTVMLAALIRAATEAGFSLPVAARIAHTWKKSVSSKDALEYGDAPWELLDWSEDGRPVIPRDDKRYPGPLRENGEPVVAAWLSDHFADGEVDPDHDARLDIINGEHLIAWSNDYSCQMKFLGSMERPCKPFGHERECTRIARLKDGGAAIVGVDYIMTNRPITPAQRAAFDQVVDGESLIQILERNYVEQLHFLDGGSGYVDPDFLNVEDEPREPYEKPQSPAELRERVEASKLAERERVGQILRSARSTISINATLAQRLAVRRALGLSNGQADAPTT